MRPSVNLRRELLFLSMAGMETCWVAGLFAVVFRRSETAGIALLFPSIYVLYLGAATTARFLGEEGMRRGVWRVVGLVLLTTLLMVKVNLYPSLSLVNPTWLTQLALRTTNLSAGVPHEILVLLLCLFVWFRGIRIPMRPAAVGIISSHFKLGALLVTGVALFASAADVDASNLVTAYFGLGLLAMALARIEEVAQAEPGATSPFDLRWVGAIAATFLVAGGMMLLMSRVITLDTVSWLLLRIASLYRPFIVLILLVVEYVAYPVLQFIFDHLPLLGFQSPQKPTLPPIESLRPDDTLLAPPSLELQQPFRVLFVVVLVLIPFLVVIRSLSRWRMRRYAADDDVREKVAAEGKLSEGLKGFVRDQWRRLQEAADPRRLFERSDVLSVRAIYAKLLVLLAARDRPRQPGQTPYEYEPIAEEVVPTQRAEIQAITEAYVLVRYGEMEIGAEELTRLQQAWHGVRDEVRSKREP